MQQRFIFDLFTRSFLSIDDEAMVDVGIYLKSDYLALAELMAVIKVI